MDHLKLSESFLRIVSLQLPSLDQEAGQSPNHYVQQHLGGTIQLLVAGEIVLKKHVWRIQHHLPRVPFPRRPVCHTRTLRG